MAELEDVTLDGKPLHSLRVADLKAALEQRGLAKSGQKNALIKRLKGALMLENLQRTSTSHTGLQPNSQIGEEMSQNSFIKQYLAKQQELLRQRMEREAREAAEADDTKSPAGPDKDEHTAANDNSSYLPDKHHIVASRASVHRSEDDREGEQLDAHRADAGTASVSQSSPDATTGKTWCPSFSQEETATPSPPRAVASLSVRVVGHPERQGVPLIVPRPQEKEGTAPVEAGPAHPMPQLSRSARAQDDSDDEEDDDDEDSDEDDDWGPSSRRKKNVRVTPQRSRRKLQPPQHIPPHHSPLQLRQPTPPPSPPPELSFPLPDTPKQSPPDQDEPEAPVDNSVSSSPSPQRQESTSSSRSSSPEPPPKRRLGPLGLLVLKMESEVAKKKEEEEHAAAEEQPGAGKEIVQDSKEAIVNDRCDAEMTPDVPSSAEKALPDVCESVPAMPFAAESSPQELVKAKKEPKDEKEQEDKQKGKDHEKLPESANLSLKREREASPSHESPSLHHSSPTTSLPGVTKRKRIFSEVPPPEWLASPSKPKQVSVLMSGPHHASADVDMEAEASAPISLIEQNKEEIKETELAKSPKESAEEMEVEKLAATQGSEEAENKKAEIEHVASSLETKALVENKSESEKAAPEDLASSNELASSQTSGAAEKMKTIRLVSRATEEIIHAPEKPQTSAESERLVAPLESVASPATGVIKPVSETPEVPHRAAKPALEVHEGETGTSKATEEIKEKMASSLAFRAELKMDSATKSEVVTEKLKSSEASKAGEEMVEATKKVAPPQSSERAEEMKGAEQVASAQVSEATEEMKVAETEQRAAQQSFQAAEEMKDAETEKPGSSQTADPAADPMEDKAEASEEMLEAEAPEKHASPCPVDSDEEMQEAEPEKQGSRPASEDSVLLPPSPPREKEKLKTTKEKSRRRKSSSSSQSSSSDSDSGSSSSSSSSSSTSSSREKANPPSHKQDEEEKSRQTDKVKEKTSREVKQATVAEPTAPVSMELQEQPESESALAHPASQEAPETSESRTDEITTPKVIAARKISLITSKPDGATVEAESASGAGRKRRWGSSTAVTAKKPSISITTESLKSLIPDLKPLQEAVVDLHPDEGRFSGDEEATQQTERNEDEGLQIRRTVTQVVPTEGQENGQKEKEEEEEDDEPVEDKEEPIRKPRRESSSEVAMETQEADTKKVTPNDSVVRRSISQQKVAVSITIDDPVRTGRQLSPPRGKTSNIIHICNLVRPFTLGQLKELLNRTGAVVDEGFWIDKIKSHCYVTYSSTEEAIATREALHGVKWPSSNPKVLRVDFCEKDELDFHKGLLPGEVPRAPPAPTRPAAPPPLLPPTREKEREREREGGAPAARDQWAEREREMERRERTRSEREWDRDKVRDFNRDERDAAKRSRSREKDRRRKERGKSKEKKSEKKDKPEEPPAKLLDDLFRKTKAAPCIYWLPLTEEQTNQRSQDRAERLKEREKIRKELEEEDKKREEERKERARGRERDAANPASGGGNSNRPTEGEKDKEREKERERDRAREKEGERRRDGNRARGGDSRPAGGARRSRSHSNPSRDRRR